MHKALAEVPLRAGEWKDTVIRFADRPDNPFVLRHRDTLEAVRALWGDPDLAQHIVYRPSKLFSDENKDTSDRVYSEMWTGDWWWKIQVSSEIFKYTGMLTGL